MNQQQSQSGNLWPSELSHTEPPLVAGAKPVTLCVLSLML